MIDLVQDRLTAQVAALRFIAGAAEFAALTGKAKAPPLALHPAAFVMPNADSGEPNRRATGGFAQRITEQFAVVLVQGHRNDATGEAAVLAIDPIIKAVRAALMGWPPTVEHDPVEYVRGTLLGLRDSLVWHQLVFQTRSYEEV